MIKLEEAQKANDAAQPEAVEVDLSDEGKENVNIAERAEAPRKKSRVDFDINTMPVRQYLECTVVPVLLQGLSALVRERPADPTKFLADYLIKNKAQYSSLGTLPEASGN